MAIHSAVMSFLKWTGAAGGTLAVGAAASPVLICGLLGLWLAGELQGAADAKRIEDRLAELIEMHGSVQSALEALGNEDPTTTAKIDELLSAMKAAAESDAEIEQYVAGNQTLLIGLTQFVSDQFEQLCEPMGLTEQDKSELLGAIQRHSEESRAAHQITHTKLDEMKAELLAEMRSSAGYNQVDESTDKGLVRAIERVAQDAESGRFTAERILESEDPNAVVDYLGARRMKLADAQDNLNGRINEELIEHDREIAATAYVTGRIDECEAALDRILDQSPGDLDARNRLGIVFNLQGKLQEAQAAYETVLESATDKAEKAVALGNLGLIEKTRGNLDAAEAYHKRSLEISEALGRKEGMAIQLGNLGLIERTRGNLDAAEAYLKRSLAINEELGRKEGMAIQLGNLGLIEQTRGNLDAAEAYLKRSLEIEEALGRKEGIAATLGNLGLIEETRGNLDAAEAYHKRSLEIEEALGRKQGIASALGNLGLIEETRGNLDAAEAYHKRSLEISEALGRKEGMANQLGNLGLIENKRGNTKQARNHWTEALHLFKEVGMALQVEQCQRLLDSPPPPSPAQ